jgi:hypothetical protein
MALRNPRNPARVVAELKIVRSSRKGPKFLGDTITLQRKGNNEDTNINSDIRVTVTGVRPDDGAATVAGADERHANYCAGENKEDAS